MKKSYTVKFICLLLFIAGINIMLHAQNFHLVKDINKNTNSNPHGIFLSNDWSQAYITLNGIGYFSADDGIHGRELWRSDGTPEGTYLLKDCYPGTGSSIFAFAISNNKIFFLGRNNGSTDLWISDGTGSGTSIIPGPSGNLSCFTDVSGELYFIENSNTLWKSDGTAAGTKILVSLNALVYTDRMVNINGVLFFPAYDFDYGYEIFRSDGTAAGTYMVKDINGSGDASPSYLTPVNGKLYFAADDGTGSKLWVSDGEATGTMPVINPDDVGVEGNSRFFATVGNTIYFMGNSKTAGSELFKYDTDFPGVKLVKDVAPGIDSSFPINPTAVAGALFFMAEGPDGAGLWKTDGTEVGTELVKNFPLSRSYDFYFFSNANGVLYFTHSDDTNGSEIWKSDGTPAGTYLVKDIFPGWSGSFARDYTFVNNQVLFCAGDGIRGDELWKTDGTESGTSLLKDINQTTTGGAAVQELVRFNNKLVFNATENTLGGALWTSDGTAEGTSIHEQNLPGVIGFDARYITVHKNDLYFISYITAGDYRLWKKTGDDTPTLLKAFLEENIYVEFGFGIRPAKNQVFFAIDNYNTGHLELWRSDGTAPGTSMLKNDFGLSGAGIRPVAVVGNNILMGNYTDTGFELWKSDGTVAGTTLVRSFLADPFYESGNLYLYKGKVFFNADDGTGLRLWKSDGTSAGTVIVNDVFRPGINGYAVSNGTLFFDAEDNGHTRQLWKTDGSAEGTKMVKLISSIGADPQALTDVNGTLFFTADDGINGRELWKSDGTEEGTRLVKDITPGIGSTNFYGWPTMLLNGNGKLYFTIANESFTELSLWESDGTEAGTMQIKETGLANVTHVFNPTAVGNQLFFLGSSEQYGDELYVGYAGVSQPPVVTITNPLNNQTYRSPARIRLVAEASDKDGKIKEVSFYNGSTLLHTERKYPYTFLWKKVPPGNYRITAKATDNDGLCATSELVNITVIDRDAPFVKIISPEKQTVFSSPASIEIRASAFNRDGIRSLLFYNGNTLLFSKDVSRVRSVKRKIDYTYKWNDVAAGNYKLVVKAVSINGAILSSSDVAVTVEEKTEPSVTSKTTTAGSKASIAENITGKAPTLKVGPDPATNLLNIYTTGFDYNKKLSLSVLSASGVIVSTVQTKSNSFMQIDISALPPGVYYIKLVSGKKILHTAFVKM